MANLFIICGHGAGDSGAVGNGHQEAERVRALASKIKAFGGNSVIIGDTSKNWYASNLVNNNNIPKGSLVLELHMDSAGASAKGAHVIIKSGLSADKYDTALATFITGVFPGRSNSIVGRSDLANPNRAAAAGINYRLLECGFISNAGDVAIFNSKMDDIAKGILTAFGITVNGTTSSVNTSTNTSTATNISTNTSTTSSKISVDGSWGVATTKKAQKVFGTTADGIISNQPTSNKKYLSGAYTGSWQFKSSSYSAGSNLVRAIQKWCGTTQDGLFGKGSVIALQTKLKALGFYTGRIDGSMGTQTVKSFQTWLNTK